jgi:hypothetical protein
MRGKLELYAMMPLDLCDYDERWLCHFLHDEPISELPVPPATTTTPIPRQFFLQWYKGHLQARPIITKMVSGSILWGLGDAVAQTTSAVAVRPNDAHPDLPDSIATLEYDWMLTGRAVFFGCVIHAPLSHGTVRAGLIG